jgi:hypothetical protein
MELKIWQTAAKQRLVVPKGLGFPDSRRPASVVMKDKTRQETTKPPALNVVSWP